VHDAVILNDPVARNATSKNPYTDGQQDDGRPIDILQQLIVGIGFSTFDDAAASGKRLHCRNALSRTVPTEFCHHSLSSNGGRPHADVFDPRCRGVDNDPLRRIVRNAMMANFSPGATAA
jgi:hypothetical protein